MRNGKSSTDLQLKVPTYLPLSEAADRYNLSENILTQLIQAGKIEAVRLPSGELLVAANNSSPPKTKEQIIEEKFAHLQNQSITVAEAIEKYDLNRSTISRWKDHEYITVLKPGYRLELDEADVAYCAYIYKQRKQQDIVFGTRLFDEEGNPYILKHPKLAEKRRKRGKNKVS
jgi:hypothetical protein